jgi:cytochrome c biogenesis protein CcmG/thiol:disulfide interchange protein DsbE
MKAKQHNTKALIFSGIAIVLFFLLMTYALKQNANFTPSQLVGNAAPDFSATIAQGGHFNSKESFNSGRWTVLNFWSSFCIVCRNEAPDIEDFYQSVTLKNNSSPQLISINIQDSKETILQWQKNYNQNFPVIQDIQGLISIQYGVTGTPETFFIDPQSQVRYRIAGQIDKNLIINFIHWLEHNPTSTQEDATQYLIKLRSSS